MRRDGQQRGMTLVELMVAMSLLAVVLATLLAVFDSLLSLSQSSSNLTVATLDAEDVMEEALRYDYEDLLNFTPPSKLNLEQQSVTVAVTDEAGGAVTAPLPDLVKLEVIVGWKERGADVTTVLSTLRSRGF